MCKGFGMFKRLLLGSIGCLALLAAGMASANAANQCYASVTEPLQKVGDTRLRVYFFRVYDATLYTQSGSYPESDSLALELNYLRNIRASQLIETTRDEWEKLGYDVNERAENWLQQLADIWPDVGQGDCLVAQSGNDQGVRFYNDAGFLGEVEDNDFSDRFFAIWLSENSSFRRNRDELVGER